MKRFLRASVYCTVVSSAIMTSLRDQTPPSARKWMSVIPYFFTQIDVSSLVSTWLLGATLFTGALIHSDFFIDPPYLEGWKRKIGGGESSDIIQDRTKQGPGSLWRCFHFPHKLNHLERLFSDAGGRVSLVTVTWFVRQRWMCVRRETQKRHSHSSYDNFNETGKEIFLHQDHGCLNWLNFDGKLKVMAVNGAAEISDPLGVI